MSLKDFFKRKKEPGKKKKKEPSRVLVEDKKRTAAKEGEKVKDSKKERKKADEGFAYRILEAPHITEKATDLSKKNKYVFKVYERANKPEIKKAVEKLYNVNVLSVKIIKVRPKKRVFKGIKGERKGYKKAVVEVKKGQKIEAFSR